MWSAPKSPSSRVKRVLSLCLVKLASWAFTPEFVFVAGGILEVQPNCVTVLSDTAIRGKDLDDEKANAAKAAAEEALKNAKSDLDLAKAQSELAVMAAQIAALRKYRQKK